MITVKTDHFEKMPKEDDNKGTWIGVYAMGEGIKEQFWRLECPCGRVVFYPLNGLPEVDTPMPCGNPNHWAVKLEI